MTIHGVPQDSVSFPERFCGGLYNVVCSATDLIYLVTKIAVAIFATMLAGICFGQSKLLNVFHKNAWEEEIPLSAKMLAASLKGIFDPYGATIEKVRLRNPSLLEIGESLAKCAEELSR